MNNRVLGSISLITLLFSTIWIGLLIKVQVSSGPFNTFEQTLAHAARLDTVFYLTYINAFLVTISATALFTGLYLCLKPLSPTWSLMGLMFIPVYSLLNICVYLSQITILPRLLDLEGNGQLLRQAVQMWPDSAVSILNILAYAVLGIPSIIYGVMLTKAGKVMRIGAILLILNGVLCNIGLIGVMTETNWMKLGTMLGGILFLAALIPVSASLFSGREDFG